MTHRGGIQRGLLRRLARSDADFVLIGGHAVAAHGHERATRDIDIVYATTRTSCEGLAEVLTDLRAEVTAAHEPAEEGRIDAELLMRGGHFRFATECGPLDALSTVSGFDHAGLSRDAIEVEIDDFSLRVCSYEALTAMKSATGRPRDQEDLRALREVNEDV